MPVNVLPKRPSSEARISKVDVSASLAAPRLMILVAVVGFNINVPVPAIAADQLISFAVKLKLPIPLSAEVMDIVPVPAFRVSAFPAPVIVAELAMVILELLALVLIVKPAPNVTAVLTSPSVTAPFPAVVLLVMIVPAKLRVAGDVGAKAPPEYVKLSVASSPIVTVPVVSNGVEV